MKRLFSILLVLLIFICVVNAETTVAPFGLEFGKSVESFLDKGLIIEFGPLEVKPGINGYLITPPKTHSQLDTYIVYSTEKYGIIKIKASKDVETTSYGTAIRNLFDKLRDGLDKAYGEGIHFDYLKAGSIWTDADDWMYALKNEDRVLTSYWLVYADDGLYEICLDAIAEYSDEGSVELSYEGPMFEIALSESEEQDNSVL